MDKPWYLAITLWTGNYIVSNISLLPPPLKLTSSVCTFSTPGVVPTGSVGCCTGASVLGHLLSPLLCTGVPISVCVCLNQGPSPASVASLPGLPRPSFSTTPALNCSLQALGAGKDCATPRTMGQGHPSRCCVWAPANCLTFRSSGFSDWSPSRPLGIK